MATVISSMAANTVPPRACLLGLASELRQKILKHVFAGSLVNIGGPESRKVTSLLQTSILATCRQLLLEGQDLLTSATTLNIHEEVYEHWIELVPAAAARLYLPTVEHVNLHSDQNFIYGFDARSLPSLKILRLRGCGTFFPVPPNACAGTLINKAKWLEMLRGEIDADKFKSSWYLWWLGFGLARPPPGTDFRPGPGREFLCDIANGIVAAPFNVVIESQHRLVYKITNEPEEDKRLRGMIVVSELATYNYASWANTADLYVRRYTLIYERVQCSFEAQSNTSPSSKKSMMSSAFLVR